MYLTAPEKSDTVFLKPSNQQKNEKVTEKALPKEPTKEVINDAKKTEANERTNLGQTNEADLKNKHNPKKEFSKVEAVPQTLTPQKEANSETLPQFLGRT